MASDQPIDPYQPPSALVTESAAPGHDRRRPGWFVTICVIAIALGATGFLHAIYGIAELTVGDPLAMVMEPPGDERFEAPAKAFEEGVRAVQLRHRPALLTLAVARLGITLCLVLGGVWCLGFSSAGRKLLMGTFAAGLLFEIVDCVIQFRVSAELFEPFRSMGQAIDEHQAPGDAGPDIGELVFVGLLWGINCVYYVCQAGKVVYYLCGLLYLRRPALDQLFLAQSAFK